MDDRRFDDLTRVFVTIGWTRRRLSLTLAGGALATLIGSNSQETAAKKRRRKKKKPSSGCTPDCAGKSCGDPNGCGGTCTACPSGQTCQGSQCVPDECDPPCRGAHFCQNGNCVCPPGMQSCDVNFCGECCTDAECPGFPSPIAQRCFYFGDNTARCACGPRGEGPCSDGLCGSCCDNDDCQPSQPGSFCNEFHGCQCPAGTQACGPEKGCRNTQTDSEACGQFCGQCQPGFDCRNGACCTIDCGPTRLSQPCCAGTCQIVGGTVQDPLYGCR